MRNLAWQDDRLLRREISGAIIMVLPSIAYNINDPKEKRNERKMNGGPQIQATRTFYEHFCVATGGVVFTSSIGVCTS